MYDLYFRKMSNKRRKACRIKGPAAYEGLYAK